MAAASNSLPHVIPFDDIVPDAYVRFTFIDGKQYLSVRDIIMHVCDKDNKRASEVWERLDSTHKNEILTFCKTFQFPGRGQSEQHVITFPGAIKLAMVLPGEYTKYINFPHFPVLRKHRKHPKNQIL